MSDESDNILDTRKTAVTGEAAIDRTCCKPNSTSCHAGKRASTLCVAGSGFTLPPRDRKRGVQARNHGNCSRL
jgi:hypothetical protein